MSKTETDKAIEEMLNGEESAAKAGTEEKTEEETQEETNTEANASDETKEEESAQNDDLDTWKRESRKWESRAKENKEEADKLASKNSELEKQLAEVKETSQAELTRWKVAAKYKVSEEDVELLLTANDEETLVKQAERLSTTSAHAPKPDAAQGTRDKTGPLSKEQQGAAALQSLFE